MYEHSIYIRNRFIGVVYRYIVKPILFRFDPELVHDLFIRIGRILGCSAVMRTITRWKLGYSSDILTQTVVGITFPNPIGLAAGFDKDAELLQILPAVGFGYVEAGSITARPCEGNPRPRLWRIPEKHSLRVYYGLKNSGYLAILPRVQKEKRGVVGISIAKTNCAGITTTAEGVADYLETYTYVQEEGIGDYITINISCPNAYGGQPFTDTDSLTQLLEACSRVEKPLPVFVKFSPDMDAETLHDVVRVCESYDVDGYVCTNLTKKDTEKGGLSGKAVAAVSTQMIRTVYHLTGGKKVVIGVGGIFTAADAYEKIKAGATLLQLISGMIYRGPQVVSEINQGLVHLLKKDGYTHLSEAVGADHR